MNKRNERLAIYDDVCLRSGISTTKAYSTSFSLCIRTLSPEIRNDIYAIYGLVRFADEIVDSFQGHNQIDLLSRFKTETFRGIEERISTNPIIHSFQKTFHKYGLDLEHVRLFFQSMEWDLDKTKYSRGDFDAYIVGSAEVVGLMCLKVFVRGDESEFERLKLPASRLGAAFQKINFLRDLQEDYFELGRHYFPNVDFTDFDDASKKELENEIEADLTAAYEGILELPADARLAVRLAYVYYRQLLRRIRRVASDSILNSRVRVPDLQKALLLVTTYTRHRLRFN